MIDHLSLRVSQALRFGRVLIQTLQQLQGVEDGPVGGVLVQLGFALVDLDDILKIKSRSC